MRDKRISVLLLQTDLQFNVFLSRGWQDGFVEVDNDESKEENGRKCHGKNDNNEPRPCEETKKEEFCC